MNPDGKAEGYAGKIFREARGHAELWPPSDIR